MTEADDRLEALRTQAGELYLKGHDTRHEQEAKERDVWEQAHEERHSRQFESHTEKHKAEQLAVEAALDAEERRLEQHRQAHDAAHAAHEREHGLMAKSHDQQWESHTKQHDDIARNLSEYKVQSNEWRSSLSDLRGTFAPITRLEAFEKAADQRFDEFRTLIATEREERRATEGTRRGTSSSIAWIITAISAVGGILAIIVILANVLTTP